MMAWVAWQTRRVARTAPLVGLLALLLLLLPWTIRNAYCFHAFIPVRSNGGGNLWIGNRPGATGFLDDSLFPMYNHQEMANYVALGEIADSRLRSTQAWDYIRAHPAIFIRLSLRRCFRFWAGTGSLGGPPIYEFHALLTTLLGFAGLVFLFRNRMRAFALLMALPMLLFPLPYYITHAEFRYRVILDPSSPSLPPTPSPNSPHNSPPDGRARAHRPEHTPLRFVILAKPESPYFAAVCSTPTPSPLLPHHRIPQLPNPSIAIIISSPAFSQRCGVRPIPTPAGVPVLITSPTSSGTIPDKYSISAGIL